jgi:hypothetical protein
MRLPNGRGRRLRASGASIGLAESIYLGEEGRVRRTEQIVLVGQVPIEGSNVKWALTRGKGKAAPSRRLLSAPQNRASLARLVYGSA